MITDSPSWKDIGTGEKRAFAVPFKHQDLIIHGRGGRTRYHRWFGGKDDSGCISPVSEQATSESHRDLMLRIDSKRELPDILPVSIHPLTVAEVTNGTF